MKIRRIISLTVFLSFIFLALSGIMLFVSPKGRVANWAGWSLLGLSKDQYSAIHTTFMVLFLVMGIWHIVLNWRPIVGYLKDRSKKVRVFTPESTFALVLSLLFLAGPLFRIPPFKQFLDFGEGIKLYWETTQGNPPWGHAEESSLDAFCRRITDFQRWEGEGIMVVDCEAARVALEEAGITVTAMSQPVLDIARANGVTPLAVSEIVTSVARAATPEEIAAGLGGGRGGGGGLRQGEGAGGEGGAAGPEGAAGSHDDVGASAEGPAVRFPRPGSGMGRMTLRQYAKEFDFELEELLGILEGQDLEVDPDARFSEAAALLGLPPSGIVDALNAGG
jgi:hypothetical protein